MKRIQSLRGCPCSMVERGGLVCLRVLPNVKQQTIKPIIKSCVSQGVTFYTDEYNIYNKLEDWGYTHKVVNHGQGEYARDEDGDGFYEVHCNTLEGICGAARAVASQFKKAGSEGCT